MTLVVQSFAKSTVKIFFETSPRLFNGPTCFSFQIKLWWWGPVGVEIYISFKNGHFFVMTNKSNFSINKPLTMETSKFFIKIARTRSYQQWSTRHLAVHHAHRTSHEQDRTYWGLKIRIIPILNIDKFGIGSGYSANIEVWPQRG